ncbi:maleate cis-trans isomerase [Halogeometricum pallidum JCM 14848]|uniref:Maleate cis-trans isomerase n=1 Tax=Halogeometricum pallidum JCM 14848 TaxID=1227487 RepID=M0CYW6_HALPD|nr:maleate cis-trans isomerase [Halogeometricum pallidum]ELZ28426.1 maleate cis-trans isomerase [Halogeometricum pallidum JCM 14848]
MRGWRARLGAVVPSSNTSVEGEFGAYAPDGVSVHAARMPLESVTPTALDEMAEAAVDRAESLSHAAVDAVAYACTTGSLLHGPGFDRELEADIAEAAGVPAVATALSVKRALRALDAERLIVATPYAEEFDRREADYLDAAGFEVLNVDGLGLEADRGVPVVTSNGATLWDALRRAGVSTASVPGRLGGER